MNKNKLLIVINIALVAALCFTIFVLPKKKEKTDCLSNSIELLDSLTEDLDRLLPEYLIRTMGSDNIWVRNMDTFNFLLNQEPFLIEDFMSFCENEVPSFRSSEREIIYKMLENASKYNPQEWCFIKKQIQYLYTINLYKETAGMAFTFTGILSHTYSKKDTIKLGEEYSAEIPFIGVFIRHNPILVLNGDTVEIEGLTNLFREKPTKRGLIQHEGYMTMPTLFGEFQMPVEFEYYVK